MSEEKYKPDLSVKKPSDKKKVEILEETVLKGTLEDLANVLNTYDPFEMTARALGYASRYRGLDFVKELIEHGATFDYSRDSRFGGKYSTFEHSDSGYFFTLYYLLLVPEKLELRTIDKYSHTPLTGMSFALQLTEAEKNVLPLEHRIEIAEYLSKKEDIGFSLDEMLFWAITRNEPAFADELIKLGADLQKTPPSYYRYDYNNYGNYTDMLSNGYGSVYWDVYVKAMSELKEDEALYALEKLSELTEAAGKKPVFSQKLFSVIKWNDKSLALAIAKYDLSKIPETKILEEAVSVDGVNSLALMADKGWLKQKNRLPKLVEQARKSKKTEALAWLMDLKNRTVDPAEELKKEEAKIKKALAANPLSVAELKKIWKFEKTNEGTLTITSYKGTLTEVEVPAMIGKDKVTVIGRAVFGDKNCFVSGVKNYDVRKKITSIVVPEGITSIEKEAFAGCSSLVRISMPDTLTEIGMWAFKSCSSLKSITIPEGIKKIGPSAFLYCSALEEVVFPKIEDPDGLIEVSSDAFEYCPSLKTVINEDSLKQFEIEGDKLVKYTGISKHVTVPEGIHVIGRAAFANHAMLQSIDLPDSIIEIGEFAFSDCTAIETVKIPDKTEVINKHAFCRCSALRSVYIPEGVTQIGFGAFRDCSSLESVRIPDSVQIIENIAFSGCTSLMDIYIPDSVTEIGEYAFEDVPGDHR